MNKTFGWKFDFVLEEHNLTRSCAQNFSKNFIGKNIKFLEFLEIH